MATPTKFERNWDRGKNLERARKHCVQKPMGFDACNATVTKVCTNDNFVRIYWFSIVFPSFHRLKIVRTAFVAVRNGICDRGFSHCNKDRSGGQKREPDMPIRQCV